MDTIFQNALQLEQKYSNVFILDRSVVLGNVCISGCTLWTHYKNTSLPKYVRIHNLDTDRYNTMHAKDVNIFEKMNKYCENNNLRHVIVTHHSPLSKDPNVKKDKFKSLYYAELDLKEFKNVAYWIFGHTHHNVDIYKQDIRFISNQFKQNKNDYSNEKVIWV